MQVFASLIAVEYPKIRLSPPVGWDRRTHPPAIRYRAVLPAIGVKSARPLKLLGCILAVAVAVRADPASAYCRTLARPKGAPTISDENGCRGGNYPPSFWLNRCAGYSIAAPDGSASSKISVDDAREVVARSFATWSSALCPFAMNGSSKPSIELRDLGTVACDKIEFNPTGTNQNTIVFRSDKWTHKSDVSDTQGATTDTSDTVLGVTILTFRPNTGEILDADMEINLTLPIKVTPKDKLEYDLQSVVTHEAGHFLGIAHSSDAVAVMNKTYGTAASFSDLAVGKRALTLDDRAAICAIYRPDGTRSTAGAEDEFREVFKQAGPCDPRPYKLRFSRECSEGGCSVSPHASSGWMSLFSALGGVLFAWRRRQSTAR